MFHFMKKDRTERDKEDKERRKREKRERKHLLKEQQLFQQQQQQLTADDLRRLEEVRRNLRDGAAADAADRPAVPPRPGQLSRPSALPPPPPPSRGILKAKAPLTSTSSDPDDAALLLKNTQANEAILYDNVAREKRRLSAASVSSTSPTKPRISPGESQDREMSYESVPATFRVRAHRDHVSPVSPPKRKQVHKIKSHVYYSLGVFYYNDT